MTTSNRALPWSVTVPSMLVESPLVVIAFDDARHTGYIEVPLPASVVAVDEAGKAVRRVRCPVDASRLGAIVNVMKGWPLR